MIGVGGFEMWETQSVFGILALSGDVLLWHQSLLGLRVVHRWHLRIVFLLSFEFGNVDLCNWSGDIIWSIKSVGGGSSPGFFGLIFHIGSDFISDVWVCFEINFGFESGIQVICEIWIRVNHIIIRYIWDPGLWFSLLKGRLPSTKFLAPLVRFDFSVFGSSWSFQCWYLALNLLGGSHWLRLRLYQYFSLLNWPLQCIGQCLMTISYSFVTFIIRCVCASYCF